MPLPRLLALARPEARTLVLATLALTVGAGLTLSYPYLVKLIVDGVLTVQPAEGLGPGASAAPSLAALSVRTSVVLLVALFLVGAVATSIRAYLFTVSGERVVARLRQQLYEALVHQEIAFFDEHRTGELCNRLASDTTVLQNAVTVNLSMLLRYGLMGFGSLCILTFTSLRLTLVMLSVVPFVIFGARIYGRLVRKVSREYQDALARSTEVAEETLAGIRTVRAFAREEAESRRYGRAIDDSFLLARRRAGLGAGFSGFATFAGYGAIGVVLWSGGSMLANGALTVGSLSAFLMYTVTLAFSLAALSGLWEDFMKAIGASERVFELLDRAPGVVAGAARLDQVEGDIQFEAVAFGYPSRPEVPVLSKLDLTLSPGEVVALVGSSGAGKSTVAALVSRFYDPQEGRVLLDGHDYRDLEASWLREQVGVVAQEPVLFATTISENIRYGRHDATDEQVEAAARAAHAHDFIAAFPQAYETLVGERGVRLSGGQKQRVAIARALLKDPRILILDEATSALDAESEHLVQEALGRLMEGRTTLVIAHRLSTVKEADRVVVLDEGRVVQEGPHDTLVVQGGLYQQLVRRQFSAA
ncbi:MAG: ABC transporter permease [Deltaproteobacteria bacterium]|nr:ABC transporter permease [Deltaproteobacteria bacterium]